jgi:predicted MFS family arabinose efflux permease
MKKHSPPGLEATGQSLFNAAAYGLGSAVGALGSGWLYDHFGAPRLFLFTSACCVVGLGILVVATAESKPK